MERTGSRSTTWRVLTGVLPQNGDKTLWVKKLKEDRKRFVGLRDKYFGMEFLLQKGSDPLT